MFRIAQTYNVNSINVAACFKKRRLIMYMFCRKNLVLDLIAALAISMSFMAVSAEPKNSKLTSVDLPCTTPEDFFR